MARPCGPMNLSGQPVFRFRTRHGAAGRLPVAGQANQEPPMDHRPDADRAEAERDAQAAQRQREQSQAALDNVREHYDKPTGIDGLRPEKDERRRPGDSDPTGTAR